MNSAEREAKKLEIARIKRMFVNEYLADFNPRAAAARCGLPEKSGAKLLGRPDVDREVNKRIATKRRQLDINSDVVLREIKTIAFTSMGEYFDPGWNIKDIAELTDDQRRCIEAVKIDEWVEDGETRRKIQIKLYSKSQALEMLGKNLKLFTERVEHDVTDGLADRLAAARARLQLEETAR